MKSEIIDNISLWGSMFLVANAFGKYFFYRLECSCWCILMIFCHWRNAELCLWNNSRLYIRHCLFHFRILHKGRDRFWDNICLVYFLFSDPCISLNWFLFLFFFLKITPIQNWELLISLSLNSCFLISESSIASFVTFVSCTLLFLKLNLCSESI